MQITRLTVSSLVISIILFSYCCQSYMQLRQHDYWLTKFKQTATLGPHKDVAWNYCDLKCVYLQQIIPNTDFFVINFKTSAIAPNIAACYAQKSGGKPELWNKVIRNTFYEQLCGEDQQDYLGNQKYQKVSEEGIGIGTPIKIV